MNLRAFLFLPRVLPLLLLGIGHVCAQSISSFTPALGTTNDWITVNGNGFISGGPVTVQFWNRKTATITVLGEGQLQARVPAGVVSGPITIYRTPGLTNSSPTDFIAIGRGPCITGFTPLYGTPGDPNPVTISGVHLTNPSSVRFNTTPATSFGGSADGQTITAYIPASASTGPIRVTTPYGTSNSPTSFTIVGQGPYIASFSPISGTIGDQVNLAGAHFTGVTEVRFNGVRGGFITPTSDTALTAFPSNGAMTGPITVTRPNGSFTTSSNFFLPPSLTGFSPPNGRWLTNVLITGTSLTNASAVTFNGLPAASFRVTNNTTMSAVVPPNATTGPIRVTTPGGQTLPSANFVVQPTVSGFSPGSGPANTSVTVTGANFNVGTPTVRFGGATAVIANVTFGSLTATVPAGASNAPVTVTTVDGSHTTTQLFYLPPLISSFTPTNGGPGTSVKISGSNFLDAGLVTFNGTAATRFVTNNTIIGAVAPAGVITGPISVTTPGGTVNSGSLLFYGPPAVTGFNPTHGLPGTNVTITGVNFLGATNVLFGGVKAVFTVTNNTTIGAAVPTNAQTGPITVIGPAGTNISAGTFTLDAGDLMVSGTDSPDPVVPGSDLVYTIIITNAGAVSVHNVMLTNTLPVSVTFKSSTTSQGSLNTSGNPIVGTMGTLNPGVMAVITLTVTPQSAGTIIDTAFASGGLPDSSPSNNTNVISTLVLPLPSLSIANLASQVQVSWPEAFSNFTLQFKGPLNATYDWSNVLTAQSLLNGSNIVVEPRTNPSRFYRLKL